MARAMGEGSRMGKQGGGQTSLRGHEGIAEEKDRNNAQLKSELKDIKESI